MEFFFYFLDRETKACLSQIFFLYFLAIYINRLPSGTCCKLYSLYEKKPHITLIESAPCFQNIELQFTNITWTYIYLKKKVHEGVCVWCRGWVSAACLCCLCSFPPPRLCGRSPWAMWERSGTEDRDAEPVVTQSRGHRAGPRERAGERRALLRCGAAKWAVTRRSSFEETEDLPGLVNTDRRGSYDPTIFDLFGVSL